MGCPSCGSDAGSLGGRCIKCGGLIPPPNRLSRLISQVETALVSLLLCAMVFLVLFQIILRNFFSTGVTGGAEIVRHLVLWVAFIGAAMAARSESHLKIDVAYRILPSNMKQIVNVLTGAFTTTVCAILFYASIRFLLVDFHAGTVIAFHDTPTWILEIVIPLGYFAVMLWFLVRSLNICLQWIGVRGH